MILCVGEILADMIGTYREGNFSYERKAGGAPFNVACGIKKFGGHSVFAGSVGDDLIGDFLFDYAKGKGLDGLIINKLHDRNTTLAFVQLDEKGERSFCFYRKNTADYILPEISDEELKNANMVSIGSLMLSEDCGFEYAKKLARRVHSLNKTVCFDVNFRTDIFRDKQTALMRYSEMLDAADIVKMSEDEIKIFGEKYISDRLADKLVCISLGSEGSEWRYRGKTGRVKSICVKPVDTTGAGDAFFAGVLTGLDGTGDYSPELLDKVFAKANVCGALNTLGRGAIDCLPDKEAIEAALKELDY